MHGGRPPGPLGSDPHPMGYLHPGLVAHTAGQYSPIPNGPYPTSPAQVQRKVSLAAHLALSVRSAHDASTSAGDFLGPHSLAFGVVYGMGRRIVCNAWELVQLFKTFILAEYWDTRHTAWFWTRFLSPFDLMGAPVTLQGWVGMTVTADFWHLFDDEAKRAHEDRQALLDGLAHIISHPHEFFESLSAELRERHDRFKELRSHRTAANEFRAGMILGELLVDVPLTIDGVAGVAKLLVAAPRLARMSVKLPRLVEDVRRAEEQRIATAAARAAAKESHPPAPTHPATKPPGAPTGSPITAEVNESPTGRTGHAEAELSGNGGLAKIGSVASDTAADGELALGAAQQPRLLYQPNPGGVARTPEYVIALAKKMGVHIPEDLDIQFVDPALLSNKVGAQAEYGQVGKYLGDDPSKVMTWDGMVHDLTGKIPVRISNELLTSDEAAVAHIAHESFELANFEAEGQWTQRFYIQQTAAPAQGGLQASWHSQAWDYADRIVLKLREQ